jgi:6-phosphogluconolactonase
VEWFANELVGAVAEGRRLAWALPGGSVAEAFLPVLAEARIDWDAVEFFWGDERAVPFDDPDSNFGLAYRLFLERVAVDPQRVHRMPADAPDLDAAAARYADDLTGGLGTPPRLDLVLLGCGPDGHICSLFPGHPALAEETRWTVAVTDAPKPPPRRLTLTLPTLVAARTICVAAFGAEKAPILAEALEPTSPLPVAHVLRAATGHLLVDPDAASLLPTTAPTRGT